MGQNTDVVILPEMFTAGFSKNADKLAVSKESDEFRWLSHIANRIDSLVIGSLITKDGGEYYNQLVWIEPSGSYKTYNKRHLFRIDNKHHHYSSGSSRLIGHWRGWNICPLICYDLRFPVWSRNQWNKEKQQLDYDLLIYVANWPKRREKA